MAETYNSLIATLGQKFDSLSYKELASFCKSLGEIGLRQEDILRETIDRIDVLSKPQAEYTFSNYLAPFNQVITPIFKAIVNLDL